MEFKQGAPPVVTIQHRDLAIKIMRGRNAGDQNAMVFILTTDGRLNTNTIDPGTIQTSTTHWTGDRLVTEWIDDQNGKAVAKGSDIRSAE